MNLNSLNGGGAPAPPAPKRGPPIAVIVIVILVIIGIVVGIVMATRPAPKAAALPVAVTPPAPKAAALPVAVTPTTPDTTVAPPPPASVPTGSSPVSSMGREVASPAPSRTAKQDMDFKQAQADLRAAAPSLSNDQLAQAQKNAGKPVQITKSPSPYAGGKIAELKGPQQVQEAMKMGGKIAEVKDPRQTHVFGMKMGGNGLTQMGGILPTQTGGKIAELKGPQQVQEAMKMGGKIAEVKGPQQVQEAMKMGGKIADVKPSPTGTFFCYDGWELVDRNCFEKCKEGDQSLGAPVYECGKCPPGSGATYSSTDFRCTGPNGGMKDPIYYKRRSMPAMYKAK